MDVMTIADAWPTTGRPFTVEDLDRMPDDGHRYELLDGVLNVSPRPSLAHVADDKPFRAERPFTVEVVPSRLVAGLLPY